MSAVTQRLHKLGILVGIVAAFAAIAALSAGSASAAFTLTKCQGVAVHGEGSSLQNTVQTEKWDPLFPTATEGCSAGPNHPAVTYTKLNSLEALEKWGVSSTSTTNPFRGTEDQFVATDEAPSSKVVGTKPSELSQIKSASGGSDVVTVPVTQSAIAIVAHPPASCTITQINNSALEKAFSGQGASSTAAVTWAEIGGTGEGCKEPVIRVVRADGSGTTYQFKHYLNTLRNGLGRGALPCIGGTWAELQEEITKNKTWPTTCSGTKLSPLVKSKASGTGAEGSGSGGGDLVLTVDKTVGSIGYAALADAEGKKETGTSVLKVQNNGTGTTGVHAVSPASGTESNCAGASYGTLPTGTLNADWSQNYGSNPNSAELGENLYPICTLTWDVSLHEYSKTQTHTVASEKISEAQARSVKDFLTYVVATSGGQTAQAGKFYAKLPSAVQTKAIEAVGQINW
jgi:hypothetical protein